MTPKRPTLRDRNRAAITTPSSPPQSHPAVEAAAAQPGQGRPRPVTVSVTLTRSQYDDARAAFLADWEHDTGAEAETFTAWIEAALRRYAALTPEQRAAARRQQTSSGNPRSFRIHPDTRHLIEAAVAADCAAGAWITLSAWTAAALHAAVEAARRRGPLPTPPNRLPPRLPHRQRTRK